MCHDAYHYTVTMKLCVLIGVNLYQNEIMVFGWVKICMYRNEVEAFLLVCSCIITITVQNMPVMAILTVLKAMS